MSYSGLLILILGVLSVAPLVFVVTIFSRIILKLLNDGNISAQTISLGYPALIPLTVLNIFGLVAYYRWHLEHNIKILPNKKGEWATALFFANFVVIPVYWYKYIYKQNLD